MSGYFHAYLKPSSLPLTLPHSLYFQPLFRSDIGTGCPYCIASLPFHHCCQPVFKAPAKRPGSEGTLETELILTTYSFCQAYKCTQQCRHCLLSWETPLGAVGTYSAHTGLFVFSVAKPVVFISALHERNIQYRYVI